MRKVVFFTLFGLILCIAGLVLYGSGGIFDETESEKQIQGQTQEETSVTVAPSGEACEAGSETRETCSQAAADSETGTEEEETVLVYICGEVVNPGVYEVSVDARVLDVLNAAGGFTAEANRNYRNLAEYVYDSEQITIPSREETGNSVAPTGAVSAGGSELVNINTADAEALTALPGIGEAKAKAIVSYREDVGVFSKPEDIMNVSGIGEALYDRIRKLITI